MSKLNQAGDTIVEVLVAIAVISMVLAASYVTTNHNYSAMRDAQERTDALKLLERQSEAMKAYDATSHDNHTALTTAGLGANGFCMGVSDSGVQPQSNSGSQGSNPCIMDTNASIAPTGLEPAYSIKITASTQPDGGTLFMATATWDSLLNGHDKTQMESVLY